jgi:hypothetical protein
VSIVKLAAKLSSLYLVRRLNLKERRCNVVNKYEIIGTDRRYYTKECYGQFDNLKDCLFHMESVNRSLGTIIKFKWREIEER